MNKDRDIQAKESTNNYKFNALIPHKLTKDDTSSEQRPQSLLPSSSSHSYNSNGASIVVNMITTTTNSKSPSIELAASLASDERSLKNKNSLTDVNDNETRSSFYGSIQSSQSDSTESSCSSSDTEEVYRTTPLPKMQLCMVGIVLLSEPLTSTLLSPFIYQMVKDFEHSENEKEIGAYAGWITSMFFVAQFCTSVIWGRISDKYGRRPVLLAGLLGNSISTCLFGLSKSLWWAMGARMMCGIMNGDIGVSRSMVSEITDRTNKARAGAIYGFCWATGLIGPVLGGYLARPAEHFPDIFGHVTFLIDYPYFLPCFASGVGSFLGFLVAFEFLEESNPRIIAKKKLRAEQKQSDQINIIEETTHLLINKNREIEELIEPTQESKNTKRKAVNRKSKSAKRITKSSYMILVSYLILSFHSMVFDQVLPLYFTAPSYADGLGISHRDYGKTLSFLGVSQLIIQFVIYPRLTQKFNTLELCRFAFFLYIPCYLLFPELTSIEAWISSNDEGRSWMFRTTYLLMLLVRFFANCLSFSGLGIMVSTSASSEVLGVVNGISQSTISFVRALAPTFGGTLWSLSLTNGHKFPFDQHFVYYIIGIVTVLGFIQSFAIDKKVAIGGSREKI